MFGTQSNPASCFREQNSLGSPLSRLRRSNPARVVSSFWDVQITFEGSLTILSDLLRR